MYKYMLLYDNQDTTWAHTYFCICKPRGRRSCHPALWAITLAFATTFRAPYMQNVLCPQVPLCSRSTPPRSKVMAGSLIRFLNIPGRLTLRGQPAPTQGGLTVTDNLFGWLKLTTAPPGPPTNLLAHAPRTNLLVFLLVFTRSRLTLALMLSQIFITPTRNHCHFWQRSHTMSL